MKRSHSGCRGTCHQQMRSVGGCFSGRLPSAAASTKRKRFHSTKNPRPSSPSSRSSWLYHNRGAMFAVSDCRAAAASLPTAKSHRGKPPKEYRFFMTRGLFLTRLHRVDGPFESRCSPCAAPSGPTLHRLSLGSSCSPAERMPTDDSLLLL
ncbi:uncharacterized protein BKA78DRAFT_108950 [Phyllosticta capitalensis]|uniref:uncharacterized protein n=1 Tax=Phyllosticta capitalensis TaxID=121624 RepID=UPI0031314FD5